MSELEWILLAFWAAVALALWATRGIANFGDERSFRKAPPNDEQGGGR